MSNQSGTSFRTLLSLPASMPTPTDTALLIIDAQNEYAHGKLAIFEVEESRRVIGEVVGKWRSARSKAGKEEGEGEKGESGVVVHICHETPEGAPVFTPGTELASEFEEIRAEGWGEEVIWKPKPCAFSDTTLDAYLKERKINKILLVGYMAHVCISATSRIGAEMGYEVSIVSDGIGDRDIPGAKAAALVETVLAELGDVSATIVKSTDL
ncbi:MAG: hypothetical protein Q9212_007548 [Teloschistes hypoglaucus]